MHGNMHLPAETCTFLRFPPWCCAVKICVGLSKAVKDDSSCDFVTEFIYSQTDEDLISTRHDMLA